MPYTGPTMRPLSMALLAALLTQTLSCSDRADLSSVPRLTMQVRRTLPHGGGRLFTEGFVFHEGHLYEGTGLVDYTALKKLSPANGAVLLHTHMEQEVPGWSAFGEGVTIFGGELIQLTYHAGRALYYSLDLKKKSKEHSYTGEGWGLTHDGARLITSDGSDTISMRDPASFAVTRTIRVSDDKGRGVDLLNELEYALGVIWANRYGEDYLLAISPVDGRIVGLVDAAALTCARQPGHAVLNGIAHDPKAGVFYLTGKNCGQIYEVAISGL